MNISVCQASVSTASNYNGGANNAMSPGFVSSADAAKWEMLNPPKHYLNMKVEDAANFDWTKGKAASGLQDWIDRRMAWGEYDIKEVKRYNCDGDVNSFYGWTTSYYDIYTKAFSMFMPTGTQTKLDTCAYIKDQEDYYVEGGGIRWETMPHMALGKYCRVKQCIAGLFRACAPYCFPCENATQTQSEEVQPLKVKYVHIRSKLFDATWEVGVQNYIYKLNSWKEALIARIFGEAVEYCEEVESGDIGDR